MRYVIVERDVIVRQTYVVGLADARRSAEKLVIDSDDDAIHVQSADEILWDKQSKFETRVVDCDEQLLETLPYKRAVIAINSNYESQEEKPKNPKKRQKRSK